MRSRKNTQVVRYGPTVVDQQVQYLFKDKVDILLYIKDEQLIAHPDEQHITAQVGIKGASSEPRNLLVDAQEAHFSSAPLLRAVHKEPPAVCGARKAGALAIKLANGH